MGSNPAGGTIPRPVPPNLAAVDRPRAVKARAASEIRQTETVFNALAHAQRRQILLVLHFRGDQMRAERDRRPLLMRMVNDHPPLENPRTRQASTSKKARSRTSLPTGFIKTARNTRQMAGVVRRRASQRASESHLARYLTGEAALRSEVGEGAAPSRDCSPSSRRVRTRCLTPG